MIDNYLKTGLPFYLDKTKQNYRRRWCYDDICTFKLFAPKDRLLPFQIKRTTRIDTITEMNLVCYNDNGTETDLLALLPTPTTLDIETAGGYDWILYYATRDLTSLIECGDYYIEITDGIQTWYSEIFHVGDFLSGGKTAASYGVVGADQQIAINNNDILNFNG